LAKSGVEPTLADKQRGGGAAQHVSAEAHRSARSSSNASRKPAAIPVSRSDDLVVERRREAAATDREPSGE
jgi:hypothetical protein